ncbi:LuxR C-terminal-related transcriptional regulator [Nocardioides sp. SYSU DS0663]|uniref:LuxR C-terminal-related transcriptional regulator n=1 Tax=Nocardioides sp. SYSU DS0663 TaxID=3416445 RepID=UPI003F4B0872
MKQPGPARSSSGQDSGAPLVAVRRIDRAPRLPPVLADRPRLLALLDQAAPLTLLRAPAGFGKTTLVAQWAARQDPESLTVAWFRLRRGARDASSFWAGLLEVLADSGVPVPPRESWPLEVYPLTGLVERALLEAPTPVALVVDGFDRASDPEADVMLADIARHVPALRVIATLRSHRWFGAPRHLGIDLTVVGACDLRLTTDETADLMAAAGLTTSASLAPALREEAGGWPEPTRAVVLRLRDEPIDGAAAVAAVVGRVAADYLRDRLLAENCDGKRMRVALLTSLPDHFTVATAELLTDEQELKPRIDELVSDGLLVAERHGDNWVYRWPAAARRALMAELERSLPEQLAELHTRLAHWYLAADEPARALRHAVHSQDWSLIVHVIDSAWMLLGTEHPDELYEAFRATPLEAVATSSRALALRDIQLRVPDTYLRRIMVELPESSTELTALGSRPDGAEVIDRGLPVLVALRLRGAFQAAQTYGERLRQVTEAARAAHPGAVVPLYPSVQLEVGLAHLFAGDLSPAQRSMRLAHVHSGDDAVGYVEPVAAAHLALTYAVAGDLPLTRKWLARYDAAPQAPRPMLPRVGIIAGTAVLLEALDRLDVDRARAVEQAVESWQTDAQELWPFLVGTQGLLAVHLGTSADVLDRLEQWRQGAPSLDHRRSTAGAYLAAVEASLLLSLGRGNLARSVLEGPYREHPALRPGRARLALLSGDDEAALRLTADVGWAAAGSPRHRLEMLVVRAVAADRLGDRRIALDALGRAVSIARATGAVRPFTTVPRAELGALAASCPAAADFLARDPLASAPDLFPAAVTLIDVTEREQDVLNGLAEGLTTQQLADRAVVSYNTVRTQQRSLYKKLGTSDRAEAISRARAWGLLPLRREPLSDLPSGPSRSNRET